MTVFFTLWALLVGPWAGWRLLIFAGRRVAAAQAAIRNEAQERRARPVRERAERDAARQLASEQTDRRRREDARTACELLYALHAPEIASRLPRHTFEQFVAKLLREDLPPDIVERKAAEIQQLILSHLEQAGGGQQRETVAQVQTWHDEQQRQLLCVSDVRLRESFEAMLLQQFHERMLRAMGDEA